MDLSAAREYRVLVRNGVAGLQHVKHQERARRTRRAHRNPETRVLETARQLASTYRLKDCVLDLASTGRDDDIRIIEINPVV